MNKTFPDNAETRVVTVEEIGARGDGTVEDPAGRYFIAYAAPGDRLLVRPGKSRGGGQSARIVRILNPGPDRVSPVCRHYGTCGGCALQHLGGGAIAALKRDFIARALARRGLTEYDLPPTRSVTPGNRRRARFVLRRGKAVTFGYRAPHSHSVVGISECPAVRPAIADHVAALKAVAATLTGLGKNGEILVTDSDTGLDIQIRPIRPGSPELEDRTALAEFAAKQDIARIAWDDGIAIEPVVARRQPRVKFGAVAVDLPLDAFLQPSREGEAAIVEAVTGAVGGAKRIADLYAGCGALTFPLSEFATVAAFEGDAAMVAAIRRAAAGLSVTADSRDLARNPLHASELSGFDTIVFDPPRAGAAAQAAEIAQSAAATVIAVSCNPASLSRDLRLLVDGGYRLERVLPIDQFPWSPHVEAVAVLRR